MVLIGTEGSNYSDTDTKLQQGTVGAYEGQYKPDQSILTPSAGPGQDSGKSDKLNLIKYIIASMVIIAVFIAIFEINNSITMRNSTSSVSSTIPNAAHTNNSTNGYIPNNVSLNASEVMYGIANTSQYVLVANNTITYNSPLGYLEKTYNYAMPQVLFIVAPKYIVSLYSTIKLPQSLTNYSAPLSTELAIYIFANRTDANNYYVKDKLDKYKAMNVSIYVTPYGVITNSTNKKALKINTLLTEMNTSTYKSFVFTMEPLYNNSAIITSRIILYKNAIVYGTNLGLINKYNTSYLYKMTNNTIDKLSS